MDQMQLIARRKLLFTSRDNATPRACAVGVTAPRDVVPGPDREGDPLSVCEIVFEGLDVAPIAVHGADSLQAVSMAADVDGYLRGLEREQGFEFFWDDGSPYFEPGA